MENCQILQSQANSKKSNRTDMDIIDIKRVSKKVKMSHKDMDLIEMAVFGDLSD